MTQTPVSPADPPSAKPAGREPLVGTRRRKRAYLFTCITLAAYAFANAFMHYLGSGEWFVGTIDQYAHTLGQPLGESLITPLSVFTHPWLLLVFGLLWAVVIVVPLLMACLYPLRYCLPFVLAVAVFAQAPVLTLFLAGGCVLVAGTPWRSRSPMLAVLLGLAPICVYLYFSGTRSTLITQSLQRLVLCAPFLIAAVGAIVAAAIVIISARLTGYRPGAVFPVVLVLLVVPVWLFKTKVGDDELAYAQLDAQLVASENPFQDEPLQKWRRPTEIPVTDAELADRVQADLQTRRIAWMNACDEFYNRYPRSGQISSVLWIRGIALDARVNARAITAGLVRHYYDYPSEDSRDTWQTLADRFPSDPRAAVACYRLALLELRAGRLREGQSLLARAEAALAAFDHAAVVGGDSPLQALFIADVSAPSRRYFQRVAEQVDTLQWTLRANVTTDNDDSAKAFAAFLAIDPLSMSRREYNDKILQLAEQYRETPLADNFALAAALSKDEPVDRAYALLDLQEIENSDASIAANYELSLLALQAQRVPALGRLLQRPEVYLNCVLNARSNPWQRLAAERLKTVSSQEQPEP